MTLAICCHLLPSFVYWILLVSTGSFRQEIHHFCCLLGFGCDAIYPYLCVVALRKVEKNFDVCVENFNVCPLFGQCFVGVCGARRFLSSVKMRPDCLQKWLHMKEATHIFGKRSFQQTNMWCPMFVHTGYLSLLRIRGCDLPLNKRIENFRAGSDSGLEMEKTKEKER